MTSQPQSAIMFDPNATCRVCGIQPTIVRHITPGVYDPENDHHFCDTHRDGMTDNEVRVWTRGWELGRKSAEEPTR
jgi:hypothetical protein